MGHLSEQIKILRKKKSWSQEDLTREISVSLSTVQKMGEKGWQAYTACPYGALETLSEDKYRQ